MAQKSAVRRRQGFVIIGQGLDREALEARLRACLLTDGELARGGAARAGLPDPFPDWTPGHAAAA